MNLPSSPHPVVYADESSNSGQNLLDPDQPVFTVAGIHLPDELAASIVDEVRAQLPPTQGEPKYGSLARSARGRKALMRAFEQLPEGSTRSYVVDKQFMVMTKMVDVLVEPLAHAVGHNLYEGKEALALAEILHMGGPVLGDTTAYQKLLQGFVDWVRQKATTDDLFAVLTAYRESVPTQQGDFAGLVDLLTYSRNVADETASDIAAGGERDLLDPAVPSLYCLGHSFGESIGQFRLVHDASKVIDRNAALLRMTHLDLARPRELMKPFPATQIDFADSRDHPQLQLADWVAGAARQWASHLAVGGGDRFSQELEATVRPWVVDAIWPANPERWQAIDRDDDGRP
ncbi:DUF3800 domain-containing protein (plasmid) [Streptomyces sp. NBC_00161]|uniref:DUF3800 domain-containing protein n=1 Tax=Streptomyces sp. NBC_00161 TaxID=2975671 RepID=UPI002F9140CA